MARAKHLHRQHEARGRSFSKRVARMTAEVERRNAGLKKRKGWERFWTLEHVTVPGDMYTYPRLGIVFREFKIKR